MCSGELDLGHVMVGEILSGSFKLTNQSEIDLQYSISLLSEQLGVVQDLTGDSLIGKNSLQGITDYPYLMYMPLLAFDIQIVVLAY